MDHTTPAIIYRLYALEQEKHHHGSIDSTRHAAIMAEYDYVLREIEIDQFHFDQDFKRAVVANQKAQLK